MEKFYFCSYINVISFLSESSQQKGWEEQKECPESPKQHLRRTRTIQLIKRWWVNNRCLSHLLWEIHDLMKIYLPPQSAGIISPLSRELLGWENRNKFSQRWQIFWKGEELSESIFSLRGKVWQYEMMLSEVESSHRGTDVPVPMKHCVWFPWIAVYLLNWGQDAPIVFLSCWWQIKLARLKPWFGAKHTCFDLRLSTALNLLMLPLLLINQ